MAKQEDLDMAYLRCAYAISELSQAKRKKVGVILVAPEGGIIAEGFNGTPSGFDNCCEKLGKHTFLPHGNTNEWHRCVYCDVVQRRSIATNNILDCVGHTITKDEVLHAESNAILKVAKSTNSSEGATLYCTLTPCFECAKLIIQAGIKRVIYAEQYPYAKHTGKERLLGLELLEKAEIEILHLPLRANTNHDKELEDNTIQCYDEEHAYRQ